MKWLNLFLLSTMMGTSVLYSQNVGINATGASPDNSAMLDVDVSGLPANNKKGLLIHRVALTSATDAATIPSPATSLLVYNTGTGGLTPAGYYYNAGTTFSPNWVRLLITGTPSDAWLTLGNAGTTAGTHFLGTTDNVDLVFKTNNTERMRITNSGNVGIGTTSPNNSALLHVSATNKGVMFPKVALTGATDNITVPVSSPTSDGMLVYNTNSAGTGTNAVTPGYVYWQSNRWNKLQTSGYAGAVFGVHTSTTPNHLTTAAPTWQYTNSYIDIPPGKWIIFCYELISPYDPGASANSLDFSYITTTSPYTAAIWVRTTLSNSSSTFSFSSYLVGSALVSGSLVFPSGFAMTSGSWYVNNTSGSTQRFYLWANVNRYNTNCGAYNFAAAVWGENQFFAIPAE